MGSTDKECDPTVETACGIPINPWGVWPDGGEPETPPSCADCVVHPELMPFDKQGKMVVWPNEIEINGEKFMIKREVDKGYSQGQGAVNLE